jgi:hypothetical protein
MIENILTRTAYSARFSHAWTWPSTVTLRFGYLAFFDSGLLRTNFRLVKHESGMETEDRFVLGLRKPTRDCIPRMPMHPSHHSYPTRRLHHVRNAKCRQWERLPLRDTFKDL